MRGHPEFNFPAFFDAAAYLREVGYEVMSPAEHDVEAGFDYTKNTLDGFDLAAAFRWDLEQVLGVAMVVLLPGWEKSSGVAGELAVARAVNRRVFEYDPDGEYGHRLSLIAAQEQVNRANAANGYFPDRSVSHFAQSQITGEQVDEAFGAVPGTASGPTRRRPPVEPDGCETRIVDPTTGAAKGQKRAQLGAIDPAALLELAEVAGMGAEKYDRNNYLKGMRWSLMADAAFRHLLHFQAGTNLDDESGLCHAAHAAWQCLALVSHYLHGLGTDDRPGTLA
jgi:hypothetical protein